MRPISYIRRYLPAACFCVSSFTSTAPAAEQWGLVTTVNSRFGKIVVEQEGTKKLNEIRLNQNTRFIELNGRTTAHYSIESLKGQRIFAHVEENPSHYATKVWIRPDVPPELDPVNPGVGSVIDRTPGGHSD